jgi:UDP-galactopyranose mutase
MYLIVGCGLSGAVIAERIATVLKKPVTIIDKRNHIGGNCYDYLDEETGIRMNQYGAHIFHTNDKEVWEYINHFSTWERWEHTVLSKLDNKYVPIPVNITTVNILFNETLQNEDEMGRWLKTNQISYESIQNSEEMAKSRIGVQLYDKLIKDYTYKQWAKYPEELDKSVLERIPVRKNFDTRYFSDKYQALPKNGYTDFFKRLLDNPLIRIILSTDYNDFIRNNNENNENNENIKATIFTGSIDSYFTHLPKLEYRSIHFTKETYHNTPFFQPNSVVNYPSSDVPYTRIVEYKHFLNQETDSTVIVYETTTDQGEPYYPVPNKKNMELYEVYRKLAEKEEKEKNVYFIGRLANYKYFNMDQANV